MNILKRELKVGLKPFLYWSLGLFFLVFAGMVKFTGLQGAGAGDLTVLFEKFPRIVLAAFGMVDLDVTKIGGYYAILSYYTLICVAIYGVGLGINAVNREAVDKTYEFLFTKPRSRSFILMIKLVVAWIYIIAFSILNYIFSLASLATLKLEDNINKEVILYSVVVFILGTMFCAIGAFIAAITKKTEKGSLYGNLFFVFAFLASVVFDMFDDGGIFRIFAPLKYFNPVDLVNGKLDIIYIFICVLLIVASIWGTFYYFNKKDLTTDN